jgi:F-type H+-transporting ATPase subunit delta
MVIKEKIIARRYAFAFLNVFIDLLKEDDLKKILALFDYFKERRQACFLMRLSLLDSKVKCDALNKISEEFLLPSCFKKLFQLLVEHKRTLLLADVFDEICIEYKKRKKIISFDVITVDPVLEEQKNIVEKFLNTATQKTVVCSYKEDITLIAGIRLQSKQYLWETSVKGRLNRVRSTLKR